jgi:heptosyltransferase-1
MNRVFFIRLRLLGDIIFTIPSIQLFKQKYPNTEIYYLVEENFKEIGRLIPGIDHLLTVPYKMGLRDILKYRKTIRKLNFQTVIDFHSGPKSALLTFLSGAGERIGYATPNRNWAFTRVISRKKKAYPTHSTFNQAYLLESFGISPDSIQPYPEINLDSVLVSDAVRRVVAKGVGKRIVIHPGTKNRWRDWGIENFKRIIERFLKKGKQIVLIGHQAEEILRGKKISDQFDVVNLCGKTSVSDLLYLIRKSDLYIGADSGPLHLASLTATPIIALYGPNIPEISGPFREKDVELVQMKMNCRPCSQKKCIYGKIKCMENISIEEVYEKSIKYI